MKRVWVITGASTGLGFALAHKAASAGDAVIGTVRKPGDAARLDAIGVHPKMLDVSDRTTVLQVYQEIANTFGRIDISVHNAGYGLVGPMEEASETQIRALFDVNVFGALWCIQGVLPHMRAQNAGHIINITSVSGLAPWSGTGLYTASKYAFEGLGQTLHDEVEPLGIHVTNVAPGGLRTDFATRSLNRTDGQITDYDGTDARMPEQVYSEGAGKEPGDAVKAADAIVSIAGAEDPPLHLLLGGDALGYWRAKNAQMADEVRANEALSLSIAANDPC